MERHEIKMVLKHFNKITSKWQRDEISEVKERQSAIEKRVRINNPSEFLNIENWVGPLCDRRNNWKFNQSMKNL